MKGYTIDDFTTNICTDTLSDLVDKKVSLLYDFLVLTDEDEYETHVRTILSQCSNEREMSVLLHDVLMGHITLTQLLHEKGVM